MATFEIQGADGKTYEVVAGSMEEAAAALGSFGAQPTGGSSVNKDVVGSGGINWTTFGANAANMAGLGLGDETMGLKAGIGSMLQGGDYLPAYRETRDKMRGDMATINDAYPNSALAGGIAGAVLPGLAASPLAAGASMLGTAGRSGGLGMLEGGLQGAGNADGRDMTAETIKGMLIGGAAGFAAPALIGGLTRGKNFLTEDIPSMFGKASQGGANRALTDVVSRSGKSLPDLDALLAASKAAGQPEYRLVDALGLPGQRALNGITRSGGAPGDEVAEFLATRQLDQGDRVGSFIEDAFDVKGTTAAKAKAEIEAANSAANDVAYTAARADAGPVNLNDTIGVIDDLTNRNPILGESALGDTEIGRRLAALRGKMQAGGEQLIDFNQVLNIKQDLYGVIKGLEKSGKTVPTELRKVYSSLDGALEASSGGYRAANDGARAGFAVADAVDEGAAMAGRGRAADNVSRFQGMPAPAQGAARVGYGDDLLNKLERVTSPTSNRAKALGSTKRVQEADAMAIDAPLYSERLGRETTMWETQNLALGGSRTADNMTDQAAMNGLAGDAMGAASSAVQGNVAGVVSKIAALLAPIAKGGQNTATRALIAKALLSGDPMTALAPAIAAAGKSSAVRRAIEAAIRQPMREDVRALVE